MSFYYVIPVLGEWIAKVVSKFGSHIARVRFRGHISRPAIVINPFAD